MKSSEIRRAFLDFYRERDHRVVPSAPLLPVEDPTLLFTSAGMVPFKRMWVTEHPSYRRAASVQKCLRATDLEDVGRTPRHCTFFEMMGHFSFGDYFKREAITWNWQLFRDLYRIPAERMRVSVFREDDEAFAIWRDDVGLPESWIFRLGEEHNFWGPAGETGPCGPSSEVYFDLGPGEGCGRPECTPGCDCDRWVEIGNFVFPQFDKQPDGRLAPLRNRGIDTGIGLERVALAVQGQTSIFTTDLFDPIIRRIEELVGRAYPECPVAMNIVADHVRALTFAFAEGIMPSNEGRGYVLRRILRRAALQGYLMGLREPFLHRLAATVTEIMAPAYPELHEAHERAAMALKGEEERFSETLDAGMQRFTRIAERTRASGSKVIPGEDAFLLYDTYGFPLDLVQEMARGEGLEVDEKSFHARMEEQKEASRRAAIFYRQEGEALDWRIFHRAAGNRFVGYDAIECETRVLKVARLPGDEGIYWIVLEETPFYAEQGGQVGDVGEIRGEGLRAQVLDTQWRDGEIVHRARLLEGAWSGGPVRARVDARRRADTARNHTATHLLHAALRQVLGTHVTQAGSLVAPERLRFDYTHYGAPAPEQVAHIERLVNQRILENIPVQVRWSSYKEALESGVIALFGEKYDTERVRRVEVAGHSRELCGGTHVRATGDIGHFMITEESALSAGVRRIEAVTGEGAVRLRQGMQEILQRLRLILEVPEGQIIEKVERLREEVARLRREVRRAHEGDAVGNLDKLLARMETLGRHKMIVGRTEAASVDLLRRQGDRLVQALGSGAALLLAQVGEKLSFLAVVTPDLNRDKGLRADRLVQDVARVTGGRGGGNPRMALAAVRDAHKADAALEAARRRLEEELGE